MNLNPINLADVYKVGHPFQYPDGTQVIYSNLTPRSSAIARKYNSVSTMYDDKVVNIGMQGVIKWLLQDLWNTKFFNKPKDQVVGAYKRRIDGILGPDAITVDHIAALHDLGYLPIVIKALPEGERVDIKVPLFTIRNTLPEFYWLTNYLETSLSAELWKTITNATIAFEYKRVLLAYAEETGAPKDFVLWQGHDFSMRGMSGVHDAAQSGIGHLASFLGTDTIPAIDYLEDYYGAANTFVGGSVPATEHSVMCMGGKEDEVDTFRRLMKQYPSGIVSIVSDTWDFWNVITNTAATLKDEILGRTPDALGLAKVVFRPDSGDPVDIICGTTDVLDLSKETIESATRYMKDYLTNKARSEAEHGKPGESYMTGHFRQGGEVHEIVISIYWNRYDKQYYYEDGSDIVSVKVVTLTPAQKGAVECLWDLFGGTVSEKGYKMLNPRVGLIYGDSITIQRAEAILAGLKAKGFASSNIVFGIGSFTYQHSTRDTFGMAVKATYGCVNGEDRELFKDPVTDNGVKKSAKGLLRVEKENGKYVLYDQQSMEQEAAGELREVFRDGKLLVETSLVEIRNRLGW